MHCCKGLGVSMCYFLPAFQTVLTVDLEYFSRVDLTFYTLARLRICNSFNFIDCFIQNLHPQVQKFYTNLQYLYVFHILRPRVLNCIL